MNCLPKVKLLLVLGFCLVLPLLVRAGDSASDAERLNIKLPAGIPADVWLYFVPKDNRVTPAKVELGRQLFFDKRLSLDGTISCATCHDPQLAFADGKPVAEGIAGKRGSRNSPTLLNAMFNASGQFWDGRAETLEAQAVLPLINPDEMGNTSYAEVVQRLRQLPEYAKQFQEVFSGPATIEGVGKAIAAFERTLVSANAPFDRFIAGDREAMTMSAQRGLALFRTRARCSICHTVNPAFPFFSDQNYRNTGVSTGSPGFELLARRATQAARVGDERAAIEAVAKEPGAAELGRFLTSGNPLDIGSFRTPSLRNIELTAPYFHNGTAASLKEVLSFYLKGGGDDPRRDWELLPLDLTDAEQDDLIAFLKSLTSDDARRTTQDAKR